MPGDFHTAFADALRDPELAPPETVRASGGKRFDVYRNNRAVALVDVLADIFPAVTRLVGADFFRAAARVYIDAHPPRDPVLLTYGRHFGDFLDDFPPAAGVPYLGDVARVEWARRDAYHAADATPVPIDGLADIPADRLDRVCLSLLPSVHLIRSRFPVGSIWADADNVDMKRGEAVIVLRPDLQVETNLLAPGAYAFLKAVGEGLSLGAAAGAIMDEEPDFDLASHLRGLFEIRAVSGMMIR